MEIRPLFSFVFSVLCVLLLWNIPPAQAESSRTEYNTARQYEHHEVDLDETKHHDNFFVFVTRPDIDAPKWDIEVVQEDAVSPGYWFLSPYSDVSQLKADGPWNGPAIYDGGGELIWSGAPIFDGWSTFDFRITNVQGKPMLSLISKHKGTATIIDETYQVYKIIEMGDGAKELRENVPALNMHEFTTVDNGRKALYMTRLLKKVSRLASKVAGFESECYITFDVVKEVDTQTWETTNEWSTEGHIGLDESYAADDPLNQCTMEYYWDYLHVNSIDTFPNGDYLVSGRRTYTIYRVSHDSGSIVWRLGGRKSDFQTSFTFSGQHAAKILDSNDTHTTISLLDNAYFSRGHPQTSNNMSRGLIVQLDITSMTGSIVAEYPHPYEGYAMSRGNMQMLPNGNAWLCWTSDPLQSEHAPDGSLIMKANFRANIASYRSFKYPWIGRPSYPPDVHATIITKDGQRYTIVHMSWNGATEVYQWKVYHTTAEGREGTLVATVPRQGFETSTWTEGHGSYVFAEALDKDGNVLGTSNTFESLPPPGSGSTESAQQSYIDSVVHDSRITLIFAIVVGILASLLMWAIQKWPWPLRNRNTFAWWKQKTQLYDPIPEEHEEEQVELRGYHKHLEDDMSDS